MDHAPTAGLVRQVLGPVAEFDEALTVAKLRGARDRLRAKDRKVEGCKSYAEQNPELRQAKRVHRLSPEGHQRSLREVSTALSTMGFKTPTGSPSRHRAWLDARQRFSSR